MILEELKQYKNISEQKLAVIIRHADREFIPDGEFGDAIILNEKGVAHARKFGTQLREYKANRIYTSPIKRCLQTAELINESLSNKVEIVITTELGDPGFHVTDAEKAGECYLKHGYDRLYADFLQDIHIEGVANKEELRTNGMSFFKTKTCENGLTLFITHDSLIAHFAHANGIKTYIKEDWVGYLEGIILKNKEV